MKRISVQDIINHPFFTTNLAPYLNPLPPQPAVVGTLGQLVAPPDPLDFEFIDGLGRMDDAVVEELTRSISDMTKAEVWECLRIDDGPQGNTLRVAYHLLRDKMRAGKDCTWLSTSCSSYFSNVLPVAEFAGQEREAQIAVMDVSSHPLRNVYLSTDHNAQSPDMRSPLRLFPLEAAISKRTLLKPSSTSKTTSRAKRNLRMPNLTFLLPNIMET